MEGNNIEGQLQMFREICIDYESDSHDGNTNEAIEIYGKPTPPSCEPTSTKYVEPYLDFEKFLQENCENRIKILNRSTFHQIESPIMLTFHHFHEKCYYLTEWLDQLYEVSLKYGDQIEFVAADIIDMDLLYPHTNPIRFFCNSVAPEDEVLRVYCLDEHKQIYEYFDAYKTVESLRELCEKLLNGKLYISQPIPEKQETFVKICVHLNFKEMVTESSKDILLIVGLTDYELCEEYEPNYEQIAQELQQSNVDIVYINGDKNYIPFKYNIHYYPTIYFIPHEDKDNFIECKGSRDKENLMDFIQKNINPQGGSWRQSELTKFHYKPLALPMKTDLTLHEFKQYINEYFSATLLKVLDCNNFKISQTNAIIYFMNFKQNGLRFYLGTLQRIYQVTQARCWYDVVFIIADLADIDIIYPKWYGKYIQDLQLENNIPQIFAIDRMQRIYKVNHLNTAASIFYYTFSLCYTQFFYSQPWSISVNNDLVKTCVGHNLKLHIKKSKSDMFLTIYWGSDKESFKLLKLLLEIAEEVQGLEVNVIKMDAELNYVPLEYTHPRYPVHFFIPYRIKEEATVRYINSQQRKKEILEFIQKNIPKLQWELKKIYRILLKNIST